MIGVKEHSKYWEKLSNLRPPEPFFLGEIVIKKSDPEPLGLRKYKHLLISYLDSIIIKHLQKDFCHFENKKLKCDKIL